MNEGIQIRSFRHPDDFDPVVDLWDRSGPGVHLGRSDTDAEITKKLRRDPELFLVAEFDGEIIGAVIGGYDGRRGLIYHLAVSEAHRQLGVGRALMDQLEELLISKGCLRSYLLITKDNPAIEFYKKQGWVMLDLYAMGKDLQ